MPGFSNYTPLPSLSLLPGDTSIPKVEPPQMDNPLGKLFGTATKDLPLFARPDNAKMTTPVLTKLSETLRYTDPALGFNPMDNNLEYKYADAHPYKTFGNNVIQFGARFLGAATEAIATIPIAVNAAWNKDFNKMYDNPVTNGINDWLDGLNNALPTYQTQYEQQHPLLKYLNPLQIKSFAGAWGSGINNLGYTAGAIAGAIAEDAVITAATGGAGLLPALGTNAAQLTRSFTKAGRLAATAAEETKTLGQMAYGVTRSGVRGSELALEAGGTEVKGLLGTRQLARTNELGQLGAEEAGMAGRELARTNELATTGGGMNISRGATGTEFHQGYGDVNAAIDAKNAYVKKINFRDAAYKLRDGAKYNLALLTSAAAEGAFEAAQNNNATIKALSDRTKEYNDGAELNAQELSNIYKRAKEGADFTMGANIALLYLSNRINWGSLFKPTTAALTEGITGWGSNIARTGVKSEFVEVTDEITKETQKLIKHSVMNVTPETRIGKILLNGEKLFNIGKRNISESFEEGAQFTINEGSTDYIKRKYDPTNAKQVGDFMKSFGYGVNQTFGTNEGLDNLVGGFIGGLLGGGVEHFTRKQAPLKEQLARQVEALNSVSLFSDNLNTKGTEAIVGQGLAKDHKDAVVKGDMHKAKNLKFDMLYNWVASGVRVGNYEKRIEELNMSRELEGKSFAEYWGMEDTDTNRAKVNEFLDGIKQKADKIKSNIEKVENVTKNPHKKGTEDYTAFENYKDKLALNMSRHEEYQRRLKGVREELQKNAPLLNIQDAVKLTSIQGITEMLQKVKKASAQLDIQIAQTQGNEQLQRDLKIKKQALDSVYDRLQPITTSGKTTEGSMRSRDVQFDATQYVGALQDLYQLTNGISIDNNKYLEQQKRLSDGNTIFIDSAEDNGTNISNDEFADILQRLQDIHKLGEASYSLGKYYTYLRKGLGMTNELSRIKQIMAQAQANVDARTGKVKTKEDIEDEIRQQEYENIDSIKVSGDKETTTEQRDIIKKAAKKTAYDEPLTKEEKDLFDEFPNTAVEYVKAEQNVRAKVVEEFNKQAEDIFNNMPTTDTSKKDEAPKTETNAKYNGADLNVLFFSLHRNPYYKELLQNLHDLIFNKSTETFGDDFTAFRTSRPEKDNLNIKEVRKDSGIKLFRKDFEEVIEIRSGGKVIGELRPPNSLFLDQDGNVPMFDINNKLNITKEQYADITKNDISTYEKFKEGAEAYATAYENLDKQVNDGERVNADVIRQFFNFSINPGSVVVNNKNNVQSDTLLKDVKIKNKAVVKIVKQDDGSYKAEMLKNMGLTDEQIAATESFVEENAQHFIDSKLANKMVAVFPVAGEITIQSFVRARFINSKEKSVYGDTIKVSSIPNIFQNFVINFNPTSVNENVQTTPTSEPVAQTAPIVEPTPQATPKDVYVKNKKALADLIKKYFNVTQEQAEFSAELFQSQAEAWAKRTGNKASEYFKTTGFNTQLQAGLQGNNVVFSSEEIKQIDKEKVELRKTLKYPKGKTNLIEEDWYTTQTPTFKAWFGNSKVVDENGDPLVQYHWSPKTDITEFNLSGIGSHFGTRVAAEDVNSIKNVNKTTVYDEEYGDFVEIQIPTEDGILYPVFLRIENPLEIDDQGQHRLGYYIEVIKEGFAKVGINLTEEDLAPFKYEDNNYQGERTKELSDLLKKYGFDGFKYINQTEDIGSTSYIALTKSSIKSTKAEEFNINKDNINYQSQAFYDKVQMIVNGRKNGGFKLSPAYDPYTKTFLGYRPQKGMATQALKNAITKWVKSSNIENVEVGINPNFGTITFKNTDPQITLFQTNDDVKTALKNSGFIEKSCK